MPVWLPWAKGEAQAAVRLLCLPPAGGAASFYRNWGNSLPAEVDVCAVQLPGRETRLREPPYTRLGPLVDALAAAIRPHLDRPFAIFGHSMGALLGFELARRLRATAAPEPLLLVVSGHRAPHLPRTRPPLHGLPRAELIEAVRDLQGTPDDVLRNSELLELVLPTMRADFAVCETYVHRVCPPLACRLVALGGIGDELVSREEVAAWRHHTQGPFAMSMLPGDHFFLGRSPAPLLAALSATLGSLVAYVRSQPGSLERRTVPPSRRPRRERAVERSNS
jgi:surfactin synthase thioesterase subunit